MMTLEVDAVLFDMDGTLVDESRSYREAARLTAEYLLREPFSHDEVDEVKALPGFNNDWDATWALVGKRLHGRILPPDEGDRSSQAYRRLREVFQTFYLGHRLWQQISGEEAPFDFDEPLMLQETRLIEAETLDQLQSFALGIATSRPRVEALMALHQHGLDRYFKSELVVAADDVLHEKPDPEALLRLRDLIGALKPVYVGDSINDALAAEAAGIPFIAVGNERFADGGIEARSPRIATVNAVVAICTLPARVRA